MPLTTLMLLTLPTPGVTNGPDYATQINANFLLIDSHDHTAGKGQPISPAGIIVNQDFSFLNFSAISLKSSRYQNLTANLGTALDKNCIYVLNGDLYYNNAAGTAVRLTAGVGINVASTGTITGDYGGANLASVVYNNTTKAYGLYQGAPNQTNPAKLACSEISISDFSTVVAPNSVTVKAPAALVTSYALTLPGALPAATKLLTLNSAGTIGVTDADELSITVLGGGLLGVKPLGILHTHLAARTVLSPVATAGNVAVSASATLTTSSAAIPTQIMTATLTTTGKPVLVKFIWGTGTTGSSLYSNSPGGGFLEIKRNGTLINRAQLGAVGGTSPYFPVLDFLDIPDAGDQVYTVWLYCASAASGGTTVTNIRLLAYELH